MTAHAVTVQAFNVYVARSQPRNGTLCLAVTDTEGLTVLIEFDSPELAIAAGIALRLEGEAHASELLLPASPLCNCPSDRRGAHCPVHVPDPDSLEGHIRELEAR